MDIIEKINLLFKEDIEQIDQLIKLLTYGRSDLIHLISDHLISSGGKRIRPLLTLISAKLCNNGGDRQIKLAAAVEFIHTATLLHDDVVDRSMLRRNRETANKIWGDKASILV
ncbi:MAG: hypothetical protein EOP34_10230, partial [Rickettsiales bacterium]